MIFKVLDLFFAAVGAGAILGAAVVGFVLVFKAGTALIDSVFE